MTPFKILTEGQILVQADGNVLIQGFATEGGTPDPQGSGSPKELLDLVWERLTTAVANLNEEFDRDPLPTRTETEGDLVVRPGPFGPDVPEPMTHVRELRERLAVALCSGHLDLPAEMAVFPELVGEYLARVAGRMAVLLTEET